MKHPERVHETELSFGKAILFYPEANAERCEAVLGYRPSRARARAWRWRGTARSVCQRSPLCSELVPVGRAEPVAADCDDRCVARAWSRQIGRLRLIFSMCAPC